MRLLVCVVTGSFAVGCSGVGVGDCCDYVGYNGVRMVRRVAVPCGVDVRKGDDDSGHGVVCCVRVWYGCISTFTYVVARHVDSGVIVSVVWCYIG